MSRWSARSPPSRASRSGCWPSVSRPTPPSSASPCPPGAWTSPSSTWTPSSTTCAPRTGRPTPGTTCPRTSRTPTTASASPRPSVSAWWRGWPPSTSQEVVYHQIRGDLEESGCHLRRHRHGRARVPRARQGVLRDRGAGRRQQVRRPQHGRVVRGLLHLRPQGRPCRDPAPGILPHQHGEHGPVRAHAHHRRRGLLRPLRRGLHRPPSTPPTPCTRRSWRSWSRRTPACATRPSRTGPTTSTTW